MGLTKEDKSGNSISTYRVLLEIAKWLSDLQGDPKTLDKIIKDSYALNDEEEKKYNTALENIGYYESLVAANKQQIRDIEAANKQLDLKAKEIRGNADILNVKETDLNKFKRLLEDRESQLNIASSNLDKKKLELDNLSQSIIDDRKKFDSEKEEFSKFEQKLKETANKLRAETAGL